MLTRTTLIIIRIILMIVIMLVSIIHLVFGYLFRATRRARICPIFLLCFSERRSRIRSPSAQAPQGSRREDHPYLNGGDAPTHVWGSLMVSALGLTTAPSRPHRWEACASRARERLAAPGAAEAPGAEAHPPRRPAVDRPRRSGARPLRKPLATPAEWLRAAV